MPKRLRRLRVTNEQAHEQLEQSALVLEGVDRAEFWLNYRAKTVTIRANGVDILVMHNIRIMNRPYVLEASEDDENGGHEQQDYCNPTRH